MYEIDGIRIGDIDYDRVCLNGRYWQVNVQIREAANGVVCTKGQGQTDPNDSCNLFSPNRTVDSVQDPNRYQDKRNKMNMWKL